MNPEPSQIKEVRKRAGLTQTQAAELIYSTKRTWQGWEAGINSMHPALWELFKLKVSGDPRTKK
jgi:DNA-binding XRE family transcriptional regulator